MASRITDRHLLFGAAVAQIIMEDKALFIKERPESQNTLFEFRATEGHALVLFKYSTKTRSPWQFTLPASQLALLEDCNVSVVAKRRFAALICHLDGICLLDLTEIHTLTDLDATQFSISVSRSPRGSYRVSGPRKVTLPKSIPRKRWTREIVGY